MKTTIHVVWTKYNWEPDEPMRLQLSENDPRDENGNLRTYPNDEDTRIYAGSFEADIPFVQPSRAQIRNEQVKTLRRQQGVHQNAITRLEEQIQSLLAIEHKP